MAHSEFKDAPPLHGWAIAVAAGALMFGVSYIVIDLGANGAVAVGAVVALIVGVIFTIAESGPKSAASAAPKAAPAPVAERVAAPEAKLVPQAAPVAAASAPAAPEAAPVSADSATTEPTKPAGLDGPVGEKDDLKRISGVGPVLEGKLNGLGFYHFWQISRWTRAEVDWVDGYLSFKGRIDRDNWIDQAKTLAADSPAKPPA